MDGTRLLTHQKSRGNPLRTVEKNRFHGSDLPTAPHASEEEDGVEAAEVLSTIHDRLQELSGKVRLIDTAHTASRIHRTQRARHILFLFLFSFFSKRGRFWGACLLNTLWVPRAPWAWVALRWARAGRVVAHNVLSTA